METINKETKKTTHIHKIYQIRERGRERERELENKREREREKERAGSINRIFVVIKLNQNKCLIGHTIWDRMSCFFSANQILAKILSDCVPSDAIAV